MSSVILNDALIDESFDEENPFNLDYHGIDFAQSFRNDQQQYRNRKEYFIQKRAIEKINSKKIVLNDLIEANRWRKLGLPKHFEATENEIDGGKCSPSPKIEVQIVVRTHEKADNVAKIEAQCQRRHERIVDLARRQLLKDEQQRQPDDVEKSCSAVVPPETMRKYPHTYKDTLIFKRNVEKSVRNHRQKVEAKIGMLEEAGISGNAQMNPEMFVDALMNDADVYEEWSASSDMEDDLGVGLDMANRNRFNLRGIHFVPHIRGKKYDWPKRSEKTCVTRDNWLKGLLADVLVRKKKKRNVRYESVPALLHENRSATDVIENKQLTQRPKSTRRPVQQIKLASILQNQVDEKYMELSQYRCPAFDTTWKGADGTTNDAISPRPVLHHLSRDHIRPFRLDKTQNRSAKIFDQHRHHEHCNPVDHKTVLVKYDVQIPTNALKMTENASPQSLEEASIKSGPIPTQNGSRFPERNENFCNKIKETYLGLLKNKSSDSKVVEDAFQIDDDYLRTVQAEIDSIHSCVSSHTSSVCTNLTNDSGSYVLVGGERVPMHHITKPWVPFEKTDRCRVRAAPLNAAAAQSVFYRVPHSGQYLEMREMTRSQRGSADNPEPMNSSNVNYVADHKVSTATHFDANYISDTRGKMPIIKFRPKSIIPMAHRVLRDRYEMLHVQESIVLHRIRAEKIERIHSNVQQWHNMAHRMFNKLERQALSNSRKANENLTTILSDSIKLRDQLENLCDQNTSIKLEILKIENEMRDRTVHQKIHYLLMNEEWRQTHDWLHRRLDDNTLENYRESIANRKLTHLRQRDTDNAWAVKEFYETNFFSRSECNAVIVFPTADSFAAKMEELKSQTAERMRKLNMFVKELIDVKVQLRAARDSAAAASENQQRRMMLKSNRKDAMEARVHELNQRTEAILDEPLREVISEELMCRTAALCNVLYDAIVPSCVRNFVDRDACIIDKFEMVINEVRELLWQLDRVPARIQKAASRNVRRRRAFVRRQAAQAYETGKRIQDTIKRLEKMFQPPTKPAKKSIKRYYLRPKVIEYEERPLVVPKSIQIFRKAFDESFEGASDGLMDDMDTMQAFESLCVPFHLDHFLKLHGYVLQSRVRTRVETRDGPEENRFKYRDVIEDTMKRYELLNSRLQQKRMKEIESMAHLYAIK